MRFLRRITALAVVTFLAWQVMQVPLWHDLLAGIVHTVLMVLLGLVVILAGMVLFLAIVVSPGRSRRR